MTEHEIQTQLNETPPQEQQQTQTPPPAETPPQEGQQTQTPPPNETPPQEGQQNQTPPREKKDFKLFDEEPQIPKAKKQDAQAPAQTAETTQATAKAMGTMLVSAADILLPRICAMIGGEAIERYKMLPAEKKDLTEATITWLAVTGIVVSPHFTFIILALTIVGGMFITAISDRRKNAAKAAAAETAKYAATPSTQNEYKASMNVEKAPPKVNKNDLANTEELKLSRTNYETKMYEGMLVYTKDYNNKYIAPSKISYTKYPNFQPSEPIRHQIEILIQQGKAQTEISKILRTAILDAQNEIGWTDEKIVNYQKQNPIPTI